MPSHPFPGVSHAVWGWGRGYAEDDGGMMLTDTAVRTAKPRDKDYKMSDAGGLYLHVDKTGRIV